MTDTQSKFVIFTRSMLALTHGERTRLLLNNWYGHQLLRNISYSRGGHTKVEGFTTTMSYKGVDVIRFNTTKNTHELLKESTEDLKSSRH